MSRTASVALKAHMALERTTLTLCCEVTRKDNTVYRYTQHPVDILFEGETYEAALGISASEFMSRAAMNVDNLEIVGAITSASLEEADVVAGLWDYAQITFFIVNYEDLTMGNMIISSGTFGEVTMADTEFHTEVRGLMQAYQAAFGRAYLPTCDAQVGDARCGLDLTTYPDGQESTTVDSSSSQRAFVAAGITQAANWFKYGKLTWTSGANAGVVSRVKTHDTGGVITLQLPVPYTISAGDGFTVEVGCNGSAARCSELGNKINFRGFDKIPGKDRLLSGLE